MGSGNFGFNADLSAKVEVNPQRNHIAVFTCLLGSIALIFIACLFAWFEKKGVIYPLLGSVAFGVAGCCFFLITHRGGALADTAAFEVKEDATGTHIKMHPSLFTNNRDFANVLTLMAHTKPLPKASGLVNKNGEIIPDSEGDALKVVNDANASVTSIIRDNLERIKVTTIQNSNNEFVEEPAADVFELNRDSNALPHDIQS